MTVRVRLTPGHIVRTVSKISTQISFIRKLKSKVQFWEFFDQWTLESRVTLRDKRVKLMIAIVLTKRVGFACHRHGLKFAQCQNFKCVCRWEIVRRRGRGRGSGRTFLHSLVLEIEISSNYTHSHFPPSRYYRCLSVINVDINRELRVFDPRNKHVTHHEHLRHPPLQPLEVWGSFKTLLKSF